MGRVENTIHLWDCGCLVTNLSLFQSASVGNILSVSLDDRRVKGEGD